MTQSSEKSAFAGERIAKVLARAGVCSRRDAEKMIADGRISVDGRRLDTPAFNVTPQQKVAVDGKPLGDPDPPRLWRYHKAAGLVTTTRDPEGRPTVFQKLPPNLPRLNTIGRLDINTEGLLLMTNDGELKRFLELPSTGWLRRYRVRAFGSADAGRLESLKNGIEIDGVRYRSIEVDLERKQGGNVWMTVALREGKNREIKRVLEHLDMKVNRLIRLSFGPFQLGNLEAGEVEEVPRRVLRQQLGREWHKLVGDEGAGASANPTDPHASASTGVSEKAGKPQRRNAHNRGVQNHGTERRETQNRGNKKPERPSGPNARRRR